MQTDLFEGAETVGVRQTKEWLEIFTGFEQRNRFSIEFGGKSDALFAAEQGSGWQRFLLGSMRPYTLIIMGRDSKPVLELRAPFRWFHREVFVHLPDGKLLGRVRRRFTFPHTRYDIFDAQDRHLYEIARGLVKMWTFSIRRRDDEVAVISKRWSGLGTEMFTDADRFQLQFAAVRDPIERRILLGALFLIDLAHFESSGSG